MFSVLASRELAVPACVWGKDFLSQGANLAQAPAVAQKPKLQCGIRASFATALHTWRVTNNTPLKKIARDLGLAVSTVNSWELGERFPTSRNFEMLVNYTGVPPCKLFCVMADKCVPRECLLAMGRKP
jgi:transcriptional regulator with XRE-family HTH domain